MTPFNALSVTTALVITGSLSAAHATPDDLDGRYAVACDSVDIAVGLQDFEFTAADGSVRLTTPESHTLSFDGLACDPDDGWGRAGNRLMVALMCAWQVDVLVGLDAVAPQLCEAVADAAVRALEHAGDQLGGTFDLTVRPGGFFGVYRMVGALTTRGGEVREGDWLVTRSGRFATASLDGIALAVPPLCGLTVGVLTQAIDGRIDREAGYTLDADYFADLSLLCDVADEGEAARVGRLGLTVRANVVGVRE